MNLLSLVQALIHLLLIVDVLIHLLLQVQALIHLMSLVQCLTGAQDSDDTGDVEATDDTDASFHTAAMYVRKLQRLERKAKRLSHTQNHDDMPTV